MRVVIRNQRDQIISQQKQRQQVERQYRAAQKANAAHERELLEFASRITPADLQTIGQLNAEGGWPRVAQALQQAGLSPQAVGIATSTVQATGGIGGLQKVVLERLQFERQESAAAELAAFGRNANEADAARLAELARQGGPEAVAQALMSEAGLSRDAAEVAFRTIQSGGLEGFGRGVQARVQHEAARQAREADEDRRLSEEPTAPPEPAPEARPEHPLAADLAKRTGERDATERKNHPTKAPEADPKAAARAAMEAAYDRLESKRPRTAKDIFDPRGESVEVPKGAERFTVDGERKAALVAAYAKLSGESIEVETTDPGLRETSDREAQRLAEDEAERTSPRAAMEKFYDEHMENDE